jgi:hypothetical protein
LAFFSLPSQGQPLHLVRLDSGNAIYGAHRIRNEVALDRAKTIAGPGTKPVSPGELLNGTTAEKATKRITQGISKKMKHTPSQPAPAANIPASQSVQRDAASSPITAKSKSRKTAAPQPSNERIALRAYFIGERRRNLGISGDATSDWVQAERELLEELKAK